MRLAKKLKGSSVLIWGILAQTLIVILFMETLHSTIPVLRILWEW